MSKLTEETISKILDSSKENLTIGELRKILTTYGEQLLEQKAVDVEKDITEDTCASCDGTAVDVYTRNGENCGNCQGTGHDGPAWTRNQALRHAVDIIRGTTKNKRSDASGMFEFPDADLDDD